MPLHRSVFIHCLSNRRSRNEPLQLPLSTDSQELKWATTKIPTRHDRAKCRRASFITIQGICPVKPLETPSVRKMMLPFPWINHRRIRIQNHRNDQSRHWSTRESSAKPLSHHLFLLRLVP